MRDGPPFPINLSIKTQKSIPKRGEGGRTERRLGEGAREKSVALFLRKGKSQRERERERVRGYLTPTTLNPKD